MAAGRCEVCKKRHPEVKPFSKYNLKRVCRPCAVEISTEKALGEFDKLESIIEGKAEGMILTGDAMDKRKQKLLDHVKAKMAKLRAQQAKKGEE